MADFTHQAQMTDVTNVPRANLSRSIPGMAHFAGTGPFGTNCAACEWWQHYSGGRNMICEKYRRLTGDAKKGIPPSTPSCRHFEERHD